MRTYLVRARRAEPRPDERDGPRPQVRRPRPGAIAQLADERLRHAQRGRRLRLRQPEPGEPQAEVADIHDVGVVAVTGAVTVTITVAAVRPAAAALPARHPGEP